MNPIPSVTLRFLRDLAANNDRAWYHDHKAEYQEAKVAFEDWLRILCQAMSEAGLAPLEGLEPKQAMYRIFRDARFHQEKAPYNPWFSAMLGPQGRQTRGAAFYLRIQPGGSYAGAGFSSYWSGDMMAALRQEIDYQPEPLLEWLQGDAFAQYFGAVLGEALKRPPKGYAADHPQLKWLRQKEWWVQTSLSETQEQSSQLIPDLLSIYQAAAPLVAYLNTAIADQQNES